MSKSDLLQAHVNPEYFTELLARTLGYKNAAHHKLIYEKLRDPQNNRLLIIMPPGHGKSTCVSVNFPLWLLGRDPNLRIIVASHTKSFVASFLREITGRMQSPEYIEVFGDLKPMQPDKWTQNEIIVNRSKILKDPSIAALGVEQAVIGRRADIIICDDIVDEDWASSAVLRERLRTWFMKELVPRLEPKGRLVVVGTRWHFADLYSELLKDEGYQKLVFPALKENGDALWPEKWPVNILMERKREISSIVWAAQYMCNPTPMEGAVFRAESLCYWDPSNEDRAQRIYKLPPLEKLEIFQGWDLAISENPSADWTVGLTLGLAEDGSAYVLSYYRGHIDFPTQVRQVEAQAEAWKPLKIAFESNAYQAALPQLLREKLLPVMEVKQTQNKNFRLVGLSAYFENGTLRVNRQEHKELILEYLQFPKGENDDILDALDLALKAARSYPRPGIAIFEPPSPYQSIQSIEREDDRIRFLRGMHAERARARIE